MDMSNDLIAGYGKRFLHYVLAIAPNVHLRAVALTQEQREVLQTLSALISSAPQDPQGFGRYSQLAGLGRWHDQHEMSVANAMRVYCGGALPELPGTDDEVVAHLLVLARDVWPSLLISPPSGGGLRTFWSSIPLGVFQHPSALAAAQAILRDDALRRLFPDAPTGSALDALATDTLMQVQSYWVSTGGRGGTQQLVTLLGLLVTNSRLASLMDSGDETWDGLTRALPGIVDTLRTLAIGQAARVPMLVSFMGVTIPDGIEVSLPHGRLFAPRQHDREFLLPESGGATAVFLGTVPMKLLGIRPFNPDEGGVPLSVETEFEKVHEAQLKVQRELDLTRLAFLLSSKEGEIWALSEVARLVLDPTSPGGLGTWTQQQAPVHHAEIDGGAGGRVQGWWAHIESKHPQQLDIAMRRVLSAGSTRIDPIDGFMDAIVAWENCFGTSTETTFRVTGAITMLLEANSAKRRATRQKALKKLYEKRSRIVHGALHPRPQETVVLRDEALQVAIECLRRLYVARSDLLPLKSEERSAQLLLGLAPSS